MRPGGWVSNARLFLVVTPESSPTSVRPLSVQERRVAADFLTALTGRRFSPAAVATCEADGLTRFNRDPDTATYGVDPPLSRWTTPAGLPYLARCGVGRVPGVWAGWRQG